MPFAEASMGTWRGPEVCAYGRTLRTAFSGGRRASRSLRGSGGVSRRGFIGRVRVRAQGSWETSRVRMLMLVASPVAEASRWSSVCVLSVNCVNN